MIIFLEKIKKQLVARVRNSLVNMDDEQLKKLFKILKKYI